MVLMRINYRIFQRCFNRNFVDCQALCDDVKNKHYDHGLRKNLIIFPQYMRKFCMLTAFIFLDPAVPPR
ncbi:hypothetical protein RIR_jg1823.t1 [Rhizophagus irregularis DAOM 181602=DAOM 197198]|nr:hypothetical protein RIR_jg1823.t1 [Rhizophagus irregularis DAOM 181602=DAOM 197198]